MCALVAQLCLTLCDPMDCSPPGSYPWDSPGKNTEVGCHFLLQGIFTQESNLGLLNCRHYFTFSAIREAQVNIKKNSLHLKMVLKIATAWHCHEVY